MLLDTPEAVIALLLTCVLLQRLPIYRSVAPYRNALIGAGLGYRLFKSTTETESLLVLLQKTVEKYICCGKARLVVSDVLATIVFFFVADHVSRLMGLTLREHWRNITDTGFRAVRSLSFVRRQVEKEAASLEASFDKSLKSRSRALGTPNAKLPSKGMPAEEILDLMRQATKTEDEVWQNGRVSGGIYHGGETHRQLLNEAFGMYSLANPLHPDIWPSVMKFDAEIVAMTASLVNGGLNTVCGTTSSGGTESIILAIKAHRDYYRDNHGITRPELICGTTAHAAVDKACDMMDIRLIKLEVDPVTFRVDPVAVRRAVSPNTILIYSSAPTFPHGAIDPIKDLSDIASQYGIGLHVDCCLGGFVLPFAKKAGFDIPDFDFSLPGVTSMSLDTHKYGFALKGTSVVLYRNTALRQSQYFCYADWTGGMYTTPTVAGSRSGGLIAQTWASLMKMGEEGYSNHVKDILKTTANIAKAVEKIPGIKLMGNTDAMIVCFATDDGANIYSIGDRMHHAGWALNALQNPACLHLCCTVTHIGREKEFVDDLIAAVEYVRSNPDNRSGNAAIYGATAALPPGPVNELLKVYNDVILKL